MQSDNLRRQFEKGRLSGLTGITFLAIFPIGAYLDYRSPSPEFESRGGHISRVFHLWLRFITFGGRSAHLAYHMHKSGRKIYKGYLRRRFRQVVCSAGGRKVMLCSSRDVNFSGLPAAMINGRHRINSCESLNIGNNNIGVEWSCLFHLNANRMLDIWSLVLGTFIRMFHLAQRWMVLCGLWKT